MGKIVVSENVSFDGIIQDPTGEEGFERGGWFGQMGDEDREVWGKVELDKALDAEALLLGRRSYEFFSARWPARSGALADRLNSMPKYVVSSTLVDPEWENSTVVSGDVATEVTMLKQGLGGNIVVYASFQLVHTLIEHDLVDEFRVTIYPSILGAGKRLFSKTSGMKSLRLTENRIIGKNLAMLAYEVERPTL